MTVEALVTHPESQTFDRKSIKIAAKDLATIVVAFANADGGTIAIGIADNGKLEGIDKHSEHLNELLRVPFDFCQPSVIAVESPGNLPSIVRLDNMRYVHFSRNPIIAKFLKAHKFVREFGEGVDRMYRELKEAGNPTPKYEQIAFMIVGTAYSLMYDGKGKAKESLGKKTTEKDLVNPPTKDLEKDLEKISKNQKRILDLMQSNPYITQEELSKEIGINAKNIRNNIQKLKTAGLLTRIGPDKGGYWQVTEK